MKKIIKKNLCTIGALAIAAVVTTTGNRFILSSNYLGTSTSAVTTTNIIRK